MTNDEKELVVITGVSGAGKTSAIGFLEDAGYYCIDNMPSFLLDAFLDFLKNHNEYEKTAIVVDIRSADNFENVIKNLNVAKEYNYNVKIIYLDIRTHIALKRYKLTRRKHPFADKFNGNISEALKNEKNILSPMLLNADFVIDTSDMAKNELRTRLTEILLGNQKDAVNIHIMSFGFKHGMPTQADFVVDVRCLPNPFWIEDLKSKTGLDKEVFDYVFSFDESSELLDKLINTLDFLTPLYIKEGKSSVIYAIGCTGGNHRSVAFAQALKEHFEKNYKNVSINHRDINRK